ncbi:unnamed protein product [Hymenolepis diminuta]|uniref:Parvovirus non-structural protein 1 helicase domain-containing protein n=1 Tax=Hymenolepis diminuta TaxID=6216 RepID=A0A564ZAR2_HYMDI|nr:unnamed protein product [Hymenolepis diminuta]
MWHIKDKSNMSECFGNWEIIGRIEVCLPQYIDTVDGSVKFETTYMATFKIIDRNCEIEVVRLLYTFIWNNEVEGETSFLLPTALVDGPAVSMGICHGTHWHVLYLASAKNSVRKLHSVVHKLLYLINRDSDAPSFILKCSMTRQLIRNPLRFLQYLVHSYNGMYFVDKNDSQMRYLWQMFQDLFKNRESLPKYNDNEDCTNPTTSKRLRMREGGDFRKRSRFDRDKSLFDLFESINIQSENDFMQWLKFNPQQLPELWSRYPNWEKKLQQYITVKIRTKRSTFDEAFSVKPYLVHVTNAKCPDALHDDNPLAGARYIYSIFANNNIDFGSFIMEVDKIIRMTYPRINALALRGPTSTGKTLIAKNIVKPYNYGTVSRGGDATTFYLQNLLDHDVALMEEPHISMTTVQNFKELFAGSPFIVQVENHAPRELHRIPCIVTTNQSLTESLIDAESEPIKRPIIIEYLLYKPTEIDYTPIICFHCWQTLCTRYFNGTLSE